MRDIIEQITHHVVVVYAQSLESVTRTALHDIEYEVETPQNAGFGDVSVNIAFKLSRLLKKAPLMIAQDVAKVYTRIIDENPAWKTLIGKVEAVKPGFINFFFTPAVNGRIVRSIEESGSRYGHNNAGKGQKVIIEFVSANPTGPLTIAHGRQACLGDTMAAVMKACGYQVTKEFYLNDGGVQMRTLGKSCFLRYLQQFGETVDFPEECYQGDYINAIAGEIKGKIGDKYRHTSVDDQDANTFFFQYAAATIMKSIKDDLAATAVSFDNYYSESSLYTEGKVTAALDQLRRSGFVYEQDGAVWFKSSELGDEKDRVLIKSDQSYTYLVPDIAYHKTKYDRGYQRIINLWGPDHHGYIPRIKASMKALGYDETAINVVIVQLTTLYRKGEPFKMSTRKGNFVSYRELIDEVGADAARLFFLLKLTDSQLAFDLELAKEKSQENPVYYLQYAYARISSILRLASETRTLPKAADIDGTLLTAAEERALITLLADYANMLITAARQCEPYRIVDYLRTLAAAFHKFYNVCRVMTDDVALTNARLCLVCSVKTVLGNGLALVGVSQPERM